MFTGIIQETGSVKEITLGNNPKISISAKKTLESLKIGESVAVNGVCLTVIEIGEKFFTANIMPETLRKTNLALLKSGSNVNLERALKIQDRVNGHIVQGHIDTVGKVIEIIRELNATVLRIQCEQSFLRYIVSKGSIAVDGVSLTVIDTDTHAGWFSVSIIPHTLENTIIKHYSVGTIVNIEYDIIAKYVGRILNTLRIERNGTSRDLSIEFLRENGFVGR